MAAINHEKAEADYNRGMKYKEIAAKYDVSINTVKSWKRRFGWNRKKGAPHKKSVHTKKAGAPHGNKNAVGNTGGPPAKNKNAVVTGEFESIWEDMLGDDERSLLRAVNTEEMAQVDQEIRLLELRERRMLKRIKELQDGQDMVASAIQKSNMSNKQVGKHQGTTIETEPAVNRILRIEESLTRIQDKKLKLIEQRRKLKEIAGETMPDTSEYLRALEKAADGVWDDEE